MYAIVEIAGQQFKVEEGKKIFVHRLKAENGKTVEFDQVLLIEDKGKVTVGEPVIKDAVVEAKVLEHLKGDKVIVFKKKRRKGYRVKNGHRQYFTQVEIVSIKEKASRKAASKKEAETQEKPQEAAAVEDTKIKSAAEPAGTVEEVKKSGRTRKAETTSGNEDTETAPKTKRTKSKKEE